MARPELGTKRLCDSCEAKFYDLNRDPIVCPSCGAQFVLDGEAKPESKPAVAKPAEKPAAKDDEEDDDDDVEIVSLEDVEEDDDDDEDIPEIEDVEIDDEDETKLEGEDDTFLEDDEEDGDVSGILGGGLSEKEDDS